MQPSIAPRFCSAKKIPIDSGLTPSDAVATGPSTLGARVANTMNSCTVMAAPTTRPREARALNADVRPRAGLESGLHAAVDPQADQTQVQDPPPAVDSDVVLVVVAVAAHECTACLGTVDHVGHRPH